MRIVMSSHERLGRSFFICFFQNEEQMSNKVGVEHQPTETCR